MYKLLLPLLCVTLAGCSSYGTSFDCPMPNNAVSCQSVSEVAKKLEDKPNNQTVIYLGGI